MSNFIDPRPRKKARVFLFVLVFVAGIATAVAGGFTAKAIQGLLNYGANVGYQACLNEQLRR